MPANMGFPMPPPAAAPEQQDFMAKLMAALGGQQGLMNLGGNLLAASGPSPQRVGLGQALGGSLLANQQFQQQQSDNQLKQLLMASQIQKANQKPRSKPIAVMGADGKPVYASEEDAIGQTPYAKAGSGIGAYQPGDYTTESWAKFQKSGDPADLQRYITPRQEYSPSFQNVTQTLPDGSTQRGTFDTRTGAYDWSGAVVPAGTAARTNAAARAEGQITGARTGKAPNAYAAYTAGVRGLESAMSNTATGPLAGRLPALTANQQIAEGAEATMAPILKQLFRDSGEGTFTDSDQALLMKMVPTRQDHPEARKAKLAMIDEIVRAKLGISGAVAPATGEPAAAPGIDALLDKYAPR